jgi:CPA2 family monovalent cation:H+ antiporter-2
VEDFSLITAIAIALGLATAGGFLARAFRLSPVVGYLFAGLVISPVTPGYRADPAAIQQLANIGVIFLMFGVGLHFNLRDLLAVRAIAIPGALIQVVAASAVGTGIGLAFDLPVRDALVLGLAISIASTIILIRTLEDRGLMGTIHARVVIGWLIAQDIITVVVLAIMPSLGDHAEGPPWQSLALALGRGAIFVALMLIIGARLLPLLLSLVARTGSRELFVLAFVAAALGIASSAAAFGLSIALGAFIAGVAVSETETSHQVAADVVPLRDAFAVLFFVSVGMLLDLEAARANPGLFLAILAAVLFVNAAIAFVVAAIFPFPGRTALVVGAGLAQLGEFTFIVGSEGMREGLMSEETYAIVLLVAAISIILNPVAFSTLDAIERVLRRLGPLWRFVDRQGEIPEPEVPRSGHVVIIGYGRVGELTGHALGQLGIPFVVVEVNLDRARALNAAGIPAIWGDAGTREVLERCAIEHARAVCITVPDESTAFVATATARALNPAVPILVRARTGGEIRPLRELGANEVVVPEYEGGLEIMRQALVVLGFDPQEALHLSNAVRDIHYQAEAFDHPI